MKHIFLTCIFILAACSAPLDQPNTGSQKTIVFVHGAWGGGWDYRNLEQMLEDKGHHVQRITLTGLGERSHLMSGDINLDTHIMDVVNTLTTDDLEDVILVGHSYGGMVITGVADRVPERIRHLVYIDAMLPRDGESVFSLLFKGEKERFMELVNTRGGGISLPPFWPGWEQTKDVPHPIGTFQQPISLGNPAAAKLPATYVLTIEEGADTDDFSVYAERAKSRGWNYHEWRTNHTPQRTMPEQYVELLANLH